MADAAVSDLQVASRMLAEGDYAAAAKAFAAIAAAMPLDSDLPAFQAMAMAKLGRLEDAEAVIAPALGLRLKNIVPLVIAAEIATLRGDWGQAAPRWRRVAGGNPRSYTRWMRFEARPQPVTPWVRHIEALHRGSEDRAAEAAWAEAMTLYPDSLALLRLPADVATARGDHARAGQHWTAALQRSGRHPELVAASLAAAWEAGPALRAAGAAQVEGGYFAPTPKAKAWNARLRAETPAHSDRTITPVPSIAFIADALVMPHMPPSPDGPPQFAQTMRGGVLDAQGHIVPNAIQLVRPHVPDVPFGPLAAFEQLPGRWLFAAAHIYGHIGHFMMDCLGRLWAAERAGGPLDGLIFMTAYLPVHQAGGFSFRKPDRHAGFMTGAEHGGYVSDFLRIFGGTTHHRVATRPLRVEELLVPSQLLSLRPGDVTGHPLFRSFIRRRVRAICEAPRDATPARLYVSRARLPEDRGLLFQEDVLERRLAAEGYAIIHPETLSIDDQLRLYWNATHIITAVGSATHIVAFAMRGHQQVALLKRNRSQESGFDDQLHAMGAARIVWVDAVSGHFADRAPGAQPLQVNRAPHALNVGHAMAALAAAGFVDRLDPDIDEAAEAAAMQFFLDRLRRFAPASDPVFVPRRR